MKGVLVRKVQAVGVGLVNRLLLSGVDCRAASIWRNGATRGMATGADIMCGPAQTKEKSEPEKRAAVPVSASPEEGPEEARVAAMPFPQSSKQKWWRPDPVTGTWVPEGKEGQVTTTTEVMKSPSRITRIRSDTTASLEDKRWWTSMEELPDMDRANPK